MGRRLRGSTFGPMAMQVLFFIGEGWIYLRREEADSRKTVVF